MRRNCKLGQDETALPCFEGECGQCSELASLAERAYESFSDDSIGKTIGNTEPSDSQRQGGNE